MFGIGVLCSRCVDYAVVRSCKAEEGYNTQTEGKRYGEGGEEGI